MVDPSDYEIGSILDVSSLDPAQQLSDGSEVPDTHGEAATGYVWPWTRLVLWIIHGYQKVSEGRPSPCRFTPSCSTYAIESLQTHGLIRGSRLAVWRILRCNPWGGQGFDPVPPRRGRRSGGSPPSCNHRQHNHHKVN